MWWGGGFLKNEKKDLCGVCGKTFVVFDFYNFFFALKCSIVFI